MQKNNLEKDTKKNILSVRNGERSSLFVIDLKKDEDAGRESGDRQEKKVKRSVFIQLFSFFYRLFSLSVRMMRRIMMLPFGVLSIMLAPFKFFKKGLKGKELKKNALVEKAERKNNSWSISLIKEKQPKEVVEKHRIKIPLKARIRELAIFGFFRFVYKFIRAIIRLLFGFCYGFGWVMLFVIRFFYFATLKIISIFLPHKILLLTLKITGAIYGRTLSLSRIRMKMVKQENFSWAKLFFSKLKRSKKAEKKHFWHRKKGDKKVKQKRDKPFLSWSFLKPSIYFAMILCVIIIPVKFFDEYKAFDLESFKMRVMGVSEAAVENMKSAAGNAKELDFLTANKNFSEAGKNFIAAQKELAEINSIFFSLAKLIPDDEARLAAESKKIVEAGKIASELGGNLSSLFSVLFEENGLVGGGGGDVYDSLMFYGAQTQSSVVKLNVVLDQIDVTVLPEEYGVQFSNLKDKSRQLELGVSEFINVLKKISVFTGVDAWRRYLFVFQNNNEMRATGGFIGSYALVDFKDGKIVRIETPRGGSYDTEGGLSAFVAAPEPLSLVNPLWHFWDANWWPDWPTSARKLMWFYEKSGGPSVDGVIGLTPSVVEKLLKITGPINLEDEYGATIDSENFWLEVQAIVEQKLTPEEVVAGVKHEPKKIIGDLMDQILKSLARNLDKENFIDVVKIAEQSLNEGHILVYLTDVELQNDIKDGGWDGRVRDVSKDYLSVINTNIAGQKTDRVISEDINLSTEVLPDGTAINTLKIKRRHGGVKGDEFTGVRNVNWLRVYVPKGSKLLEASGFEKPDEKYFEKPDIGWSKDPLVYRSEDMASIDEASDTRIYEEFNKTVFANWTMVDPGGEITIFLKYQLPFKLFKKDNPGVGDSIKKFIGFEDANYYNYSLFVQKQSGAGPANFKSALKLPQAFQIAWKYPDNLSLISDGWFVEDKIDTHKYFSVLLEDN